MTKQKVPPDHEWDENGKCKWCPAEYPNPPPDPEPGEPGDVPMSSVIVSPVEGER